MKKILSTHSIDPKESLSKAYLKIEALPQPLMTKSLIKKAFFRFARCWLALQEKAYFSLKWTLAQILTLRNLINQWVLRRPLPNFFHVSKGIFRSGQPTKQGYHKLKKLGIHLIINLRKSNHHFEEAKKFGIEVVHYPLSQWGTPSISLVKNFFQLLQKNQKRKVLIHCLYGADRTGIFIALYRMIVEGWSKTEAIKELTEGGFGYHFWIPGIIPFLQKLDLEALRKSHLSSSNQTRFLSA